MAAQKAEEARHAAWIGKITLEIDAILLREDCSMGDLLEIFDRFTSRANSVFANTKLKSIAQNYDRQY